MPFRHRVYLDWLALCHSYTYRFAHKPLCSRFRSDVLNVGGIFLCRSCTMIWLGLFTAIACCISLWLSGSLENYIALTVGKSCNDGYCPGGISTVALQTFAAPTPRCPTILVRICWLHSYIPVAKRCMAGWLGDSHILVCSPVHVFKETGRTQTARLRRLRGT